MSQQEAKPRPVAEMIDILKDARHRSRLQAHLLSLEAKQRWQALETTFINVQLKLEQGGEQALASATAAARDVTQAVKDLFHELDGSFELTTPVKKLMNQAPASCSPDEPLSRAAQIMWEHDCGAVPVVGADGSVLGMLTDRDVCMAAYTRGVPLGAISVRSTMSREVHACAPDDSLGHAVRLMAQKQVHRLPVTESGRLVGLITLADLARDVRGRAGNPVPASIALAHALASISERRSRDPESSRVAAE